MPLDKSVSILREMASVKALDTAVVEALAADVSAFADILAAAAAKAIDDYNNFKNREMSVSQL
jgi:hypothetical protein